ncbi:hypothetical protein [Cryobacterium lactosi]|uniref:hypothetical protein n=1 Tax=Cryobacterium lactosi TaxID=1259202 RepID=UPI00141B92D2|nr:hypothetical protein [Cryobacterium lactosi]
MRNATKRYTKQRNLLFIRYGWHMEIISGVVVEDSLLAVFVEMGRLGHNIALAHHNDPGSNGFTFGVDRYQRSCELVKDELEAHGFRVRNKGAGLRATRDALELHFATAKTADVEASFSFDRTTDSRIDAGRSNSLVQSTLDGLDHVALPGRQIIHTVWSGNSTNGLIAVNVGRLVVENNETVTWSAVRRIDKNGVFEPSEAIVIEGAATTYIEQPMPELGLEAIAREPKESNESRHAEQK